MRNQVRITDYCKRTPKSSVQYTNVIMFDEENECAVATNGFTLLVSKPDYKKKNKANEFVWYRGKEAPIFRGKLYKHEQSALKKWSVKSFPNYHCAIPMCDKYDKVQENFSPENLNRALEILEKKAEAITDGEVYIEYHKEMEISLTNLKIMAKLPKGNWYFRNNLLKFQNSDYTAIFMLHKGTYYLDEDNYTNVVRYKEVF